MKRLVGCVLLALIYSSASADGSFWQSTWDSTVRQTRAIASEVARRAPAQIREIRRQAEAVIVRLKSEPMPRTSTEQRALLTELWQVRDSLDLLALLEPSTLRTLTGLNVPDLSALRKTILGHIARLQPQGKG